MTSLRDVMVANPIGIGPDATVAEAAAAMASARVGSLMVEDLGAGVGIITERDVMRAAGAGGDLLSTRVRDWMTVDPTTGTPDQDVDEAVVTMLSGGFRHLPVIEGDVVVGIVSMRSLLSAQVGRSLEQAGEPDEVSSDPAPTASPAQVQHRRTRMFEATRLLKQHSQADADDVGQWRADLGEALDELEEVLTTHIAETEGADGFLEELVRESEGRLAPAVRRLGKEHERSTELVAELRAALEGPAETYVIRRAADELFAQLEAHRHRGSDLLWRAYAAEIGVGD